MEDRIIELEVRASYQDKLLADLEEVIRTLAQRLELQEKELERIKEMLAEQPHAIGGADERPPHY